MNNMMFKNLVVYDFTRDFFVPQAKELDSFIVDNPLQGNLEHWLDKFKFSPCGSQDAVKCGWATPLGGDSEMLTHFCGDHILLVYKEEKREIPPQEFARRLTDKIKQLEQQEGRALKKKEKEAFREDLFFELLPRAFSKFSRINTWIDLKNKRICVEATSASKAEKAISLLRKTIGSLPVIPFGSELKAADTALTQWVLGEPALPAHFKLGYSAKLNSIVAGDGRITIKDRDLKSDEVQAHLLSEMMVEALALDFGTLSPLPEIDEATKNDEKESDPQNDFSHRISFTLTDGLYFKAIKFADFIFDEVQGDDAAAIFDANFALVTGDLSGLLNQVNIDLSQSKN